MCVSLAILFLSHYSERQPEICLITLYNVDFLLPVQLGDFRVFMSADNKTGLSLTIFFGKVMRYLTFWTHAVSHGIHQKPQAE
jgi:hypothetical protein